MAEPLSVKKFTKSFFEWMPWVKNIRFILGLIVVLFICVTIYRAYFMKTKSQQIQIGKVGKGGTVIIEQKDDDRKVGLEFFVTSNVVGAQFRKDIGGSWSAGFGGQYNFKEKEPEPRVSLMCEW